MLESVVDRLGDLMKRRWIRWGLGLVVVFGLTLVVLFSALVVSPFEGSNARSLAEIVPGKVQVFVSQTDLEGRYRDFSGSSVDRELRHSRRLRQFFRSPFWLRGPGAQLQELRRQLESVESQIGFDLMTERNLFELLGKEWSVGGILGTDGHPESWIFATRVGFRIKLVAALFLRFGEPLSGMSFRKGSGTVGIDVEGNGVASLFLGRVQDILLVGNRESLVADAVQRARGGEGDSVSQRAPSTLRDNQDQLVSLSLSPRRIQKSVAWIKHLWGKERGLPISLLMGQSRELLGFSSVESLEGSLLWPTEDRRRLTLALGGEMDLRKVPPADRNGYRTSGQRRFLIEEILPDSIAWYRVNRISLETTWDRWLASLATSAQANTMRSGSGKTFSLRTEMDRYLSYVEQVLGRPDPIRRELFPASGEELGLVVFPVDYSPFEQEPTFRFPGAAVLVHLRDPGAAARVIEELATQTLRYFHIQNVVRESDGGFEWFRLDIAENIYPLSIRPTFGVFGEFLVLATHDSIVREIRSVLAGEWKPLVTTRSYRNAFRGMSSGGRYRSWVGVDRVLEVLDDLSGYLSKQAYETQMGREGRVHLRSRLERQWRRRYPDQGEAFHEFLDEKVNEHEVEFLAKERMRRREELERWRLFESGAVRIGIRKGQVRIRANLFWRP